MSQNMKVNNLERFISESYKLLYEDLAVIFRNKKESPFLVDFYSFFYIEAAILYFLYFKIDKSEIMKTDFLFKEEDEKKEFQYLYEQALELGIDDPIDFCLFNVGGKLTETSSKMSKKNYFYTFDLTSYKDKFKDLLTKMTPYN